MKTEKMQSGALERLVSARKLAEQAVEGMADVSLKAVAFETILRGLISGQEPPTPTAKPNSSKPRRERPEVPTTKKDRILVLKEDQFFAEPKGIGQVQAELKVRGWIYPITGLSGPMQQLVQSRMLRRALVKIEGKEVYGYVNP